MKLLCMINREAWAVGTLARLFKIGAPDGWTVEIRSHRDIDRNPNALKDAVAESDIVHWAAHKSFSHYVNQLMLPDEKTAHVVTMHHFEGDEEDLGYLSKTKGVAVHAEKYLKECRKRLPDTIPVEYIPYPVGNEFFEFGESRISNKYVNDHRKPFRIGFFSSAQYETGRKGVDLIPAIAEGLTERVDNWEIIVTGLGWNAVLARPEFCDLPIRHVVPPSYFDMPKAYSQLDAYLCLSRIEGGPMTVFEAIACGVPVVSTPVGRVPDTLEAETMYRHVAFDDISAVIDELSMISNHPDSIFDMSAAAIEKVKNTMSAEVYQEKLLQFYERALGKNIGELGKISANKKNAKRLRRKWRAWDRTYWAKELWMTGKRKVPIQYILQSFLIDPFSEGLWRVPLRKLGFGTDEK